MALLFYPTLATRSNSDGSARIPACQSHFPIIYGVHPAHIPLHKTNPAIQVQLALSPFDQDRLREKNKENGGEIPSSICDPGPDVGLKPSLWLGLVNEAWIYTAYQLHMCLCILWWLL